jgi:hypothetical protein
MSFQHVRATKSTDPSWTRAIWICVLAGLAAVLTPVVGQQPLPASPPSSAPPAAAVRPPAAPVQADSGEQQAGKQNSAASTAERKKQVAEKSARLLKLATDLKTEVDKTSEDTLSLTVIRKADAIEKMARIVREDAKPSSEAN